MERTKLCGESHLTDMTSGHYRRIPAALRTPREEYADAATHALGFVLSVGGAFLLIPAALRRDDPFCLVGCVFYLLSVMTTFAASTLSHLYFSIEVNKFFRKLDQAAIYTMIVCTFAPFALTFLRTPLWMIFYGLTVVVAAWGFISKMALEHRLEGISVFLYVVLGTTQGVSLVPLLRVLPVWSSVNILLGGMCYLVGVYFLVKDVRRYSYHTIWHVLVVVGSTFYFFAVLQAVRG